MDQQNRIFRQTALAKLASPEQLDQLMQVTSPKSWLALAAFGVVLLTALAWSIFGTIPSRVHGPGILIKPGGVYVVTARGEGNIRSILVRRGDIITTNQVVALLNQPELELRIEQAEKAQQGLEQERKKLLQFHQAERAAEEVELTTLRSNYAGMLMDSSNQILSLETRASALNILRAQGLKTGWDVLEATNNLYAAKHEQARAKVQLLQLNVQQVQTDERRRQRESEQTIQIVQGAHQLELLRQLYELSSKVRSPYAGEVLEIMVKDGQLISPSTPILSLQLAANQMEARLYLNPADGKLVHPRMPVALSLVSFKKEEYGLLLGRVSEVSQFPATPQGMLRILENTTLASEFSKSGAPIEVGVELEVNNNSPSGFSWSSGDGPPTRISSGTLCQGTVTIESSRRPISLLFPILREKRRPPAPTPDGLGTSNVMR